MDASIFIALLTVISLLALRHVPTDSTAINDLVDAEMTYRGE